MSMTAFVDVAIGLTLLYLGTSLFVTIINEYLAQLFNLRAQHLKTALDKLFSQKGLERILGDYTVLVHGRDSTAKDQSPQSGPTSLLAHFQVWLERVGLKWANDKVGSYVDTNLLAQVVVGRLFAGSLGRFSEAPSFQTPQTTGSGSTASPGQVIQDGGSGSKPALSTIVELNSNLPAGVVKDMLVAHAQAAGTEVSKFTQGISEWFDRTLTVLGESYKKMMQRVSLVVGLVVAASLNIDTLTVTDRLYHDKELRDQAVLVAEEVHKNTDGELIEACKKLALNQLETSEKCKPVAHVVRIAMKRGEALNLPIGWTDKDSFWEAVFSRRALGWLLTALASSLGAPFWFDFLNTVINIRHGMKRPTVSKEDGKT